MHIKFIWLPLLSHVKSWLRKAQKSFSAIKECTPQNEISGFCMYVQSSMKTDNYIIIWILYVCILYLLMTKALDQSFQMTKS